MEDYDYATSRLVNETSVLKSLYLEFRLIEERVFIFCFLLYFVLFFKSFIFYSPAEKN